ncbi:hypothetical protein L226DRAFT_575411 [Lentinus tigrinus ALCF2SS1-7]|uniref:uncharacterized protein n=1 Tax=Lentinus tigrinus ALCF2SS1-7 TaxID=1328758 RepID=UPI001165D628|nr:hypothetical protein L226DRAFT_575411 [Lentinus tigrinus ALCF2SS1-7]
MSRASLDSEDSGDDREVDLSYYTGYVQEDGALGREKDILGLTNFERDDYSTIRGEAQFNLSVHTPKRSQTHHDSSTSRAARSPQRAPPSGNFLNPYSPPQYSSTLSNPYPYSPTTKQRSFQSVPVPYSITIADKGRAHLATFASVRILPAIRRPGVAAFGPIPHGHDDEPSAIQPQSISEASQADLHFSTHHPLVFQSCPSSVC